MKLTPNMRQALELARRNPLRRTHDTAGKPPWPAHPNTLLALIGHDLLKHTQLENRHGHRVDVWEITDLGKVALEPVETIKLQPILYLSRPGGIRYRKLPNNRWVVDDTGNTSGDYTTDPSRSVDTDRAPNSKAPVAIPTLVQPHHLDEYAENAAQRQNDHVDALDLNQRLANVIEQAKRRKRNLQSDARLVRFMIDQGRTRNAEARLVKLEQDLQIRAA